MALLQKLGGDWAAPRAEAAPAAPAAFPAPQAGSLTRGRRAPGQVPTMCREEDLFSLFTPFGTVRNLHLLKGADGKPRGCAMVRAPEPGVFKCRSGLFRTPSGRMGPGSLAGG